MSKKSKTSKHTNNQIKI